MEKPRIAEEGELKNELAPIQYRELDPKQLENEIATEASDVRAALQRYEDAKAVSQEVLDAQVCV